MALINSNGYLFNNKKKDEEEEEKKWYSGDKPTRGEVLGKIMSVSEENPTRGQQLQTTYKRLTADPTSEYYDPYSEATNKAVSTLGSFGIDVSNIDDNFFKDNNFLTQYLKYDGTTNTPTKPGSKASAAEQAAYAFYQIWKSEDATKKAESQWDALQKELTYWAQRTDRNYSNEEIKKKIDWSKYDELVSMDKNKQFQPNEYNRAIGYSQDAIDGVLWKARNPENADVNMNTAMAAAALGKGNGYQFSQTIADKLDPDSKDFQPYSLGSTNVDDAAAFFGVSSFTKDWINKNRHLLNDGTDEEKKYMSQVLKAEENQDKVDAAYSALQSWAKDNLGGVKDPEEAKKKIDDALKREYVNIRNADGKTEKVDISILNTLDATMGKGEEGPNGDLTALTRGTQYKYNDFLGGIMNECNARKDSGTSDGANLINTNTNIVTNKAPTAEENPVQGMTVTEDEIAVMEADDKELRDAQESITVDGTEAEQTQAKYSWSTMFDRVKDYYDQVAKEKVEAVRALAESGIKNVANAHCNASLNNVTRMYDYDTQQSNKEAVTLQIDALDKKLGDKQYAAREVPQTAQQVITVNGKTYRVTIDKDTNTNDYYLREAREIDADIIESGNEGFEPVVYDEAEQQALKNSAEFQALVSGYSEAAEKITAAREQFPELTEQDMADIEQLESLNLQLSDIDEYLQTYKGKYDEAKAGFDAAQNAWYEEAYVLKQLGVDTTDLERENETVAYMSQFGHYEATAWSQYNPSDAYRIALAEGQDPDAVYAAAKEGNDEVLAELDKAKQTKQYIEEYGLNVPQEYMDNLDRHIAKLERDTKDYEYFVLSQRDDFDELAQKGRDMEYENRPQPFLQQWLNPELDWTEEEYFAGVGSSEYDPTGVYASYGLRRIAGPLAAQMTEKEKDTYYVLMALGEEDRAVDYVKSLADMSYGVLHTRYTDEMEEKTHQMFRQQKSQDFDNKDDAEEWIADNGEKYKDAELYEDENGYHVSYSESTGALGFIGANILAILSAPVSAMSSLGYGAYSMATGDEINPKNAVLLFNNFRSKTMEESSKEIADYYGEGTVGQKLVQGFYEILRNRLDSMVNSVVTGGLDIGNPILSELVGSMPMGISAAMDAMIDVKNRGGSDAQAYGIGLVTLIMETGTEAVTRSNIMDALGAGEAVTSTGVKDFLKNWITSSGIEEMCGETLTEYIENLSDEKIMGAMSNHADAVWAYRMQGYTPDEAEAKARQDEMSNLLRTALISYLSPGLDIVSYGAGATDYYRQLTKSMQQEGLDVNMAQVVRGRHQQLVEERMAEREAQAAAEQNTIANGEGALNLDAVPAQNTEAEQEASPAQQAANAKKEALLKDYELLHSANTADVPSKTATVASVLDEQGTPESNDTAKAAATNLGKVLGEDADVIGFTQQVMLGAAEEGVDSATVKQAISNAALGGEQSAARQMIVSDEFQSATPAQQATMLASTVEADANNATVQSTIRSAVYENRIAEAEKTLVANGALSGTKAAEQRATEAAANTTQMQAELDEKQKTLEATQQNMETVSQEFQDNPTDDNLKRLNEATQEVKRADISKGQYEQAVENAQADQQAAEAELSAVRNKEMKQLRLDAQQVVMQENQTRAEAAAIAAEEQRKADEAAAQAQAEEDERSGVAQERRDDSMIEAALDNENLQGEERDVRREELKEQADKVKIRIKDLKAPVNKTEGFLAVRAFSRKLGINIAMKNLGPVDGTKIVRGAYQDGTIYLNSNLIKSGKMTIGQAVVEAALHEITHSMETTKSYRTYRSVVLDAVFGAKGGTNALELYKGDTKEASKYRAKVDDIIKQRIAAGDENFVGQKKDDQIKNAEKEIIADFARMNLAEKDVVQRFMDAGIGGRMRNTLHNINQALKNYLPGMDKTERTTAEYLRRSERAFQKAINEVAKQEIHPSGSQFSVQQIAEATNLGMTYNDETLQLFLPDGREVDGVKVRIEPEMIVNTPVGMLIDMGLSDDVLKDKDGNDLLNEDGSQRTQKSDARKMFADLMNLCARYKDNNLVWEIAGSEFAENFSALKSNSDPQYKNTVDFGTICSKTQAIVDVISGTMLERINSIKEWNEAHPDDQKVFTGLTRDDIMMVYDKTHDAKLSVPCPVCYVFSRWMGVPSLLGQMNRFQHEYVVTKKDENGKTVYDADGKPVIDWDATKETANNYIKSMLEKYGSKDKIADTKTSLKNKINTREENLPKLQQAKIELQRQLAGADPFEAEKESIREQLKNPDLKKGERSKLERKLTSLDRKSAKRIANLETKIAKKDEQITTNIRETDQFMEDMRDVEAFNWVTQALCVQHTEDGGKVVNDIDENGDYVIDQENFELTPEEILFDLNRTGEFAAYKKNWKYRTTRGAGMGKAIMPYSGASIGDIINGEATRWQTSQNPFLNMDREQAQKAFDSAKKRVQQQNLVGGQRFQSTSDFRPEWGLDYVMSFLEMQALGSKVQMYTKVAEAVDFLGSIGADVNLSIMARGDGYHEATAEEIEQAKTDPELASRMGRLGDKTYVMEFSDVTGMDYNTAKGKSKKFNNVQMILVGMNDVHIRLAMANGDIDFIIPWHSSGNSKDVLQSLVASVDETLTESSDYTDTQTDQFKFRLEKNEKGKEKKVDIRTEDEKNLWNARVKLLTEGGNALTLEERNILLSNPFTRELYKRFTEEGYDPDCYNVKLPKAQAEQVFPYEYWDKTSTRENADVNGVRFAEYCDALGLVPRFEQFKNDPGYWKLLIDRKMFDNNVLNEDGTVKEYGKYREQKVVDVTKARIDTDASQELDAQQARKAQVYQLPESTSAKYGKDYSAETKTAIDNASAELSKKYDVSGRYNAYAQQSLAGDLTQADIDLMSDAASDYMSAMSRGDTKAAKEDVAFYAEQNGYTETVYHGTPTFGFTEFDMHDGQGYIFASYRSDISKGYAKGGNVRSISSSIGSPAQIRETLNGLEGTDFVEAANYLMEAQGIGATVTMTQDGQFAVGGENRRSNVMTREKLIAMLTNGSAYKGVYRLYARPGDNPLVIDAEGAKWDQIKVPWSDDPMVTNDIAAYAKENGYTSVRIDNVDDRSTGSGIYGDEAGLGSIGIFFNQQDVKSADTATYDADGNLIPLDQRFTSSPDIRYSVGGEMTEADREAQNIQTLQNAGVLTQEDIDAYNSLTSRPMEGKSAKWSQTEGPAQRQFGGENGMLQESDELDQQAIDYVMQRNAYFPDTNADQVRRAVNWIRQNGTRKDENGNVTRVSDGFAESLAKVTGESFDYRSADGQARMIATMAMAVAKNDVSAQVALADAFNRQGTDLGRSLQSRKLFRLMTPEGRIGTLQKMLQNTQDEIAASGKNADLKFSEWIYRAASAAESEEDFRMVQKAAAQELAEQVPANWKDKVRSLRMLSMLGNPRTHIRNVVGNAMFVPVVSLKNKLGALGEIVTGQEERTKTLAPVLSKEVRAFAKQDAAAMKDVLTGEAKYNETNMVQREQKAFKGLLQGLIDFNGDMLEKEDWTFLKGHYKRALGGWMQANGYTAEQLQNNAELLEKGRAYAVQEAQKATYRDFNTVAATLNEASRNGGAIGFFVDAVLPFKKTPANILRRGIEYSPVGIMKSITADLYRLKQYNDYQNGKLDVMPEKAISPNQFIDNLCSGLAGTTIMVVGALLGSAGIVSCGLDDDDDEFEKAKGGQEYAIKFSIGGQDFTYTMDWAAPMSMPFFVGAAIQEQLSGQEGFDVESLVDAFGNITEPVFNLSMLDGVNTLFKTSQYDDTNTLTQIGAKIASNYLTSYVPSLLGAVARTVDDTRRKAYVESGKGTGILGTFRYAREQVENKIPGLSQTNIPYRDIFGNAETSSLAERIFENFISPGYVNAYNDDPVIKEMDRLYSANVTDSSSLVPKDPAKTIDFNNQKYVLSAEQWDQYKATKGQTAHAMLTDMIGKEEYQKADEATQVQMIKSVWDYADKVGKKAAVPEYEAPEETVGSLIQNGEIASYNSKMMASIAKGDFEGYDTMVEALHEAGVADTDIKETIARTYRNQYKEAYLKGDNGTMSEIEELLNNTGYDFDLEKWEEQADKKNNR